MMRRGFTVLEVLVALSIFAYASVTLVSGYLNVLNGYARARELMQSDQDIKFARAALLAQPDHDLATAGANFTTVDGRQVDWAATITPTNVANLFEVEFEVTVTPVDGAAVTTVETFRVLRPTWSTAFPGVATDLQNTARQAITALYAQ